jgi:glycosyltransferase involved in cell wall biosynthesis
MKYLYVKDGDAISEARRAADAPEEARSGTGFYVADFLQANSSNALYIVCRWKKAETLQIENVFVESLEPPEGGAISRILKRAGSALALAGRIRKWKPERILCGRSGELLWTSAFVARLLGIPLVHARHNEIQPRSGFGRISSMLDRWSIRSCVGVVCHGQFLVDQVKAIGVDAARVEEFKLPVSNFGKQASASGLPMEFAQFRAAHPVTFMFVGRVQRAKGVFDLVDAARSLLGQGFASVGLVYVGDGSDLEALKAYVIQQRMGDSVLFLGRFPHHQLADLMSQATAVVTPTRPEFPEGRCMVVIESLVLGVPVVAPDSGPFPYAVKHGTNGLLFVPGSVTALLEALELFCTDQDLVLRLREGAKQSGMELQSEPHQSFSEAVSAAFSKNG